MLYCGVVTERLAGASGLVWGKVVFYSKRDCFVLLTFVFINFFIATESVFPRRLMSFEEEEQMANSYALLFPRVMLKNYS